MTETRILVVDDEESIRQSLVKVLKKEGYLLAHAANGIEAMRVLQQKPVDITLTDLRMPEMNGIELLEYIRKNHTETEVVLITGHGTIERAVEAIKLGAYDFITKPFKRAEILKTISNAAEKVQLARENRMLRQQLADSQSSRYTFIGESKSSKHLMDMVARVAPLPSTVLITGESGTGKEIVARLLHQHSSRSGKQFVAVNCGAIAENLMESELFGHIKGAFTGAMTDKQGLFRTASGGTLFLDEISTLPANLQIKLLRVLQEQEVMPVGASRTYPIDVRIVAASNRNLEQEVTEGRFREDLYYRLNVVALHSAPLRERREDIPILAEHFINKFNLELNKLVRGISPEAMPYFVTNDWKGNVRELENTIERAMIMCDGDQILPEHLPLRFKPDGASEIDPQHRGGSLKEAVMEFEKLQIAKTLKMVEGDKRAAAKILDLSLSSLYRKMSEVGLET